MFVQFLQITVHLYYYKILTLFPILSKDKYLNISSNGIEDKIS